MKSASNTCLPESIDSSSIVAHFPDMRRTIASKSLSPLNLEQTKRSFEGLANRYYVVNFSLCYLSLLFELYTKCISITRIS